MKMKRNGGEHKFLLCAVPRHEHDRAHLDANCACVTGLFFADFWFGPVTVPARPRHDLLGATAAVLTDFGAARGPRGGKGGRDGEQGERGGGGGDDVGVDPR